MGFVRLILVGVFTGIYVRKLSKYNRTYNTKHQWGRRGTITKYCFSCR